MDFRTHIAQQARSARYVIHAGSNQEGEARYLRSIHGEGEIYTTVPSLTYALRFSTREKAEAAARKCGINESAITSL